MKRLAVVDDTELMLRVKSGDGLSFGLLLDRHRAAVERFLYSRVRNRALAEELAQEVFLRVYRARDRYEPTARFTAWLFQIAAHLGSNSRRDHRRDRLHDSLDIQMPFPPALELVDVGPSAEERLLREVFRTEVRRAVAALPPKQREAVVMHKFEGLDYAEIALAFGCSQSAVKSLMFRAHESLRESLAHLNAA